ncbi:MAG: lytic transglycosylase domain-containing protein [Deltaproteobacteria bacterium]|nr:lytic transglycosylase domain-containing protein [Deltaproteobacteria bacterium]MBW2385251.1 lytic transglycosylase domain-containing protein [Deltaproteobacteria bacterium]
MRRVMVVWLAALGFGGMSCHFGTLGAPARDAARANIEAARPSIALADAATHTLDLHMGEAEMGEAEILAELRRRHTALADHELVVLSRTIVAEAHTHQLDPALVMAVIQVESGGYHLAVSPVGALGLMQLMPGTGEELARKLGIEWCGAKTLFDPIINVRLGTAYLRELTNRYDHMPTALAAYNWGPGRIDRKIRRGARVPSGYIDQVMKAYDRDIVRAGRS